MTLYGGIETGGTSITCLIGSGPDDVVAETRFATTTPAQTIGHIIDFFQEHRQSHPVEAVGVGSFGPVDLDRKSSTYGFITSTPKPGWQQVDLCRPIGAALRVPIAFDTDVNAAALGEYLWGAQPRERATSSTDAACGAPAPDPLLYVTVGTGIGVGAVIDGRPLHGLLHPEAGHMLVPHDRTLDPFAGACPFHGDCWEGLASGFALQQRWGQRAETLAADHPAWHLEAHYLGLGIANLIYCLSPRRVVVGGGVLQQPGLLDGVRRQVQDAVHGYLRSANLAQDMRQFIVAPRLGSQSGALGALALAARL